MYEVVSVRAAGFATDTPARGAGVGAPGACAKAALVGAVKRSRVRRTTVLSLSEITVLVYPLPRRECRGGKITRQRVASVEADAPA